MNVLVTGAAGQLGHDVVLELTKRHHTAIGVDVADMDITDSAAVHTYITKAAPDAVIHCAAWTAVDNAEDIENQEKVYEINASGTKYIADDSK